MRLIFLLASLLLTTYGDVFALQTKEVPLNSLNEIKANLTFACVHETVPASSSDADMLFQYARWLQKNNQLKQDKVVDVEIERLYRIAAENGHYKANINLQNGAMRGQFNLRGAEHLRLSQELIDAGVATGYYFIGIFLQQGAAGLEQDPEMALRYYRKAADLGNAQSQYFVADKLAPSDIAPDVAREMRRCAAEQGHGEAAVLLGIYLKNERRYPDALKAFQMGAAAGYSSASSRLDKAFRNPPPSNELHYLGQQEDLERAERYEKIWRVLANYSYASPSVPEINDIVPLPPAKLPPWDGKLQWLEARLANVAPPKPTDALINELAQAKLLEPATGKTMPGSPAFIKASSPAPTCHSGQACPQSGYWQAWRLTDASQASLQDGAVRHFDEGEILPTQSVERHHRRFLRADTTTVEDEIVEWRLLG
ncbi:sel1 repeat family protein [Pseudomonas tolaasii]|uniref:SEL1-like repeat protein n=1 Tax=Pseudomonas tolaasii TaxID=29442 RepID=UPI001C576033|nr:DUF6396 domain-containing protein [Pseudomonas tolaasii]MBW1250734.1 sel1 repeat family protein [Pseudomonas tolaasii]